MWIGVQSPSCGLELRRHMAETSESDELVPELVDASQKPYGYVDNEPEDDAGLLDAPGAAVLTARPPDTSKKHARRVQKKQAERAKLTSVDDLKKVELKSRESKFSKQATTFQKQKRKPEQRWPSQQWTSQQSSNWESQQSKRPRTSQLSRPPPPPSLFSKKATAAPTPLPADIVPSVQSSNPFGKPVPSQPQQIPENLPPGTIVCILPQ